MSDSDSFINEVSDELRRDRLFAVMRRWGWLAGLVVLGLVGGAAWLEYNRAQEQATAEAFGDALLAALDLPDPEARVTALSEIDLPAPEARIILALLAAGEVAQGGAEASDAAAQLRAAAEAPDLPRRYRDLALLKAEMLAPSEPDTARLILGTLAEPGAPYAALAEEQLALLALRTGDTEAALELLRGLERSAAATPGLQERASQLIVALESGAELVETAPEPEPEPEPQPEAEAEPEQDAEPEPAAPVDEADPADGTDVPAEEE